MKAVSMTLPFYLSMEYHIHYGYVSNETEEFVPVMHKEEILTDGKQAMARYCEIQMLAEEGKDDVSQSFFPPENSRFNCSVEIFKDGEFYERATLEFFCDAFNILKQKHQTL